MPAQLKGKNGKWVSPTFREDASGATGDLFTVSSTDPCRALLNHLSPVGACLGDSIRKLLVGSRPLCPAAWVQGATRSLRMGWTPMTHGFGSAPSHLDRAGFTPPLMSPLGIRRVLPCALGRNRHPGGDSRWVNIGDKKNVFSVEDRGTLSSA